MIALIPVRHGVLPLGALETVLEVGGSAWLVGSGCDVAAKDLDGFATEISISELSDGSVSTSSDGSVSTSAGRGFAPRAMAQSLAPMIQQIVVLPASPDGRDLAPYLAASLSWPLYAGATRLSPYEITVARRGGRVLETHQPAGPYVATLQPGVRSADPTTGASLPEFAVRPLTMPSQVRDAEFVAEQPPDPATMDLAEAPRIVGGGAGLGGVEEFASLADLAALLGASLGGTRVVMDTGLVPFERQIGTTGVIVDPDLYLALGISGAVQHTAGLGQPEHIISVNTDPHCPMMAMADLAIECDAADFLDALNARLGAFDKIAEPS